MFCLIKIRLNSNIVDAHDTPLLRIFFNIHFKSEVQKRKTSLQVQKMRSKETVSPFVHKVLTGHGKSFIKKVILQNQMCWDGFFDGWDSYSYRLHVAAISVVIKQSIQSKNLI